jgi:hypothetical protein
LCEGSGKAMLEPSIQPDQNLTHVKFGKAVKIGDLVYSTFLYYSKVTWFQGKFIEIGDNFYDVYFSDGESKQFSTDTDLLEPSAPEGDLFYVLGGWHQQRGTHELDGANFFIAKSLHIWILLMEFQLLVRENSPFNRNLSV